MANNTERFIFQFFGETRGIEKVNKAAKDTGANMKQLAIRAAAVIPVWILLRATMLALPRAISAATKEWISFQTEMSRVETVTRGSAKALKVLESGIKDFAATSKASFKDTASAVYALGSAGLTSAQQLGGLNHVMNVAIGTGANVEQTAKLMSGAFNVFGKKLKDATTDAARWKKIADTISFTYSTQQVELSELATALGYVASVGSLVDITFEELVTTIGVLNTGMLKGSKSGTSLVNAFIQLANKSDKLSTIGIDIDTSKPLKFKDVMDQLYATFGKNKLSLEGLQKIMSVFGIRGGRAVGLLLTNYKFFNDSLKKGTENAKDFAEIMKRIAEDNIEGMATKIRNSLSSVWMDVLDDWETPFMAMLKRFSTGLDEFRAREKSKKWQGLTTTASATAKSVPQFGGAGLAFLAGRNLPGFKQLQPKITKSAINARSEQLAQNEVARIGRGGGITEPGVKGARPLTKAEAKIRATGKTSSTPFRREAYDQLRDEVPKLNKFALGARAIGKYAVIGYAGLKLMQGMLNQLLLIVTQLKNLML